MADSSSGSSRGSFLQKILEHLTSSRCFTIEAEHAEAVAVVALQKYLSEQSDSQQVGSYSYDVTVTDGSCRAKCLLHPSLNHLVHSNTLRTGRDVYLSQCSFVYSERKLGHGYICIDKLRCGPDRSSILTRSVSALPLLLKRGLDRSAELHSDVPLQVIRKHYLPLWNNDDSEGEAWNSGPSPSDAALDVSKITLLSSLPSNVRTSLKLLPLLVKIIHKSRLRYYGKFGLRIEYPYQAYFEVADQSGIMSLVLWNDLCLEFYQRLSVGTVLYLQNYTVKQSYSNRSHPQMKHHRMKTFTSVEICLNPRNPASLITVLSPKSVQPQWGLPDVSYQFVSRSELEKLADNSACDIIGVVTFVGRTERVRAKGDKALEKFWTYRWVHAVDGTSDRPFILELFSSSQAEIFNRICPMTYLVCTQMRVCHVAGSLPYLTTSCETEMFITGYHKGRPYLNDPGVKSFIQWTKTLKDNVILQKTTVGGHYSYPQPPQVFTKPVEDAVSGQTPLVSATDLKRELESLQYRERKTLAIQGQVTAIKHFRTLKAVEPAEKEGLEKEAPCHPASTAAPSLPSLSPVLPLYGLRKRKNQISEMPQSPQPKGRSPAKRRLDFRKTRGQKQGTEADPASGEAHSTAGASKTLSWESSGWSKQRQEVSEHLRHGELHPDSITRKFVFDEKDALLQQSNLQPARWTPEQTAEPLPPVPCPEYYQITILGINKQMAVDAAFVPVLRSDDPRAAGLPADSHDNTMLSCLSSGFICPLIDPNNDRNTTPPAPGNIVATAGELEGAHVVCVLDLCHLGEEKVEVLMSKMYRVSEVSLE